MGHPAQAIVHDDIARTAAEKRALLAPLDPFKDGVVILYTDGTYAWSASAFAIGRAEIENDKWHLALPVPGGWPGQAEAVNAYCDNLRKSMENAGYD